MSLSGRGIYQLLPQRCLPSQFQARQDYIGELCLKNKHQQLNGNTECNSLSLKTKQKETKLDKVSEKTAFSVSSSQGSF